MPDTMPVNPAINDFLDKPRPMLIGGDWVPAASGETFAVINPADGSRLAAVASGDKADVDKAVAAARQSFESESWAGMMPSARAKVLWRLADLIEANSDELAMLESLDNGKPVKFARSVDIPGAAESFRYYAGWCTKIEGKTVDLSRADGEYHAYTLREPVGVAGLIVPWNFPLLMAAWKVSPALAAGCSAVLKPAEQTPLTALRLGELALEAGVPAGVLNIVTGYGHTAGAAMADHTDIDKIAFTGSTGVGKRLVQASAVNLKKVSLELGGKSPNVIMADADMERAIPSAAMSSFFNSGQVCVASTRLFIQESVVDQVVEAIGKVAANLKVRPGLDKDSVLGPLVSEEQLKRVLGYIESGKEAGAEIAFGGKQIGDSGYFVEPTVVVNTTPEMKIQQEEIFGPVVTATPFKDADEAAALANDTSYGLAANVWTRDLSTAHKLARRIKAGSIWVNTINGSDMAMPFGGYKQSGWGRESGFDGVELYLQTKSVAIQLG